MEAKLQTLQTTGHNVNTREEVFVPQETLDHPCDIILVGQDGKQFKAHRQVLSEASPFFEKLLNSDMWESKEGVIRLEMLTEPGLRDILEFIYTGSVQILDEDHARDLIEMADYLFLPQLKNVAGRVLAQKLDISTCFSTYYYAERYQCEELVSATKQFILANFTTLANTEDFLKMSNREVEVFISSDEIDVSSEEDVFKVILAWIDHDKNERKKYFVELFRHVRLVYVSRDFLRSAIVTDDLVKDNEGCLDLVKDALKSIESENFDHISVTPRKSLETPVIAVCTHGRYIFCYLPGDPEDSWRKLPLTEGEHTLCFPHNVRSVFACHGKIYFVNQRATISRYDTFSYRLTSIPRTRNVMKRFVNQNEVYALVRDDGTEWLECSECATLRRSRENDSPLQTVPNSLCGKDHFCSIAKYNPGLNSWENITTVDSGMVWYRICIVASDNYIYFVGDTECSLMLSDANRYDLRKNKWDKIADIRQQRWWPFGASANGKVFITGADHNKARDLETVTCEMYDEATNEWEFIASLKIPVNTGSCSMISVDGKIYVLNLHFDYDAVCNCVKIQCYDPVMNEWHMQTDCKIPKYSFPISCTLRLFQASRLQKPSSHEIYLQNASSPQNSSSLQNTSSRRKCFTM